MKGFGEKYNSKKKINKNSNFSKEQLIDQAFKFHSEGKISEAIKCYQHFINQGFEDQRLFYNYGVLLKSLGKLKEAESLYRKALEINPNFAEAYYNLGSILKDFGNLKEAELSYLKAIEVKPDFAMAHLNLGGILKDLGKFQEAKSTYSKAIEIKPNYAEAYYNLGTILKDLENLQEAESSYRKAIEIKPDFAQAHYSLGIILKDLGKFQEAESSYRKAIEIKPNYAEAYLNLGGILKDLGNLQEAKSTYSKAIEIKPNYAEAYYNLGAILKDLGNLQEAESSYRKTIKIKPDFAQAHYSLGIILKDLGNLKEAELSILKSIEIEPNYAEAHLNLGVILLQKSENLLSLKYFSESAELLRGQKVQEPNHKRFTIISKAKIAHDIEQFKYISKKGYDPKKFNDLAILYEKVASEIDWPSETKLIPISNKHKNLLEENYNRLLNQLKAPKLEKEAVNNSLNVEKITNNYFNHEFGLTYIDNFLSPKAIESLRDFLLGSTIWFHVKKGGYLGAYLKDGLASPLIIQIADELRKKFPKIFKDHQINQIWAYKYDSRAKNKNSSLKGINVHADFAAVNVNFWITPKEANLNPNSGGLIVYDVEAPLEWDFKTYNNNEMKIREELKKSKGNTKVIPYNENRAVVFNSNLFHETDHYEFKEGYENRRINVTMLFGKRSDI